MRTGNGSLSPVIALLALSLGSSRGFGLDTSGLPDAQTVATALRTSKSVAFAEDQSLAWKHPVLCDGSGNVFLVPVPRADPRDVKAAPAPPRYTRPPSDILVVSTDGKIKTVIKPEAVPAFAKADAISTVGLAFDSSSTLHAVVRVTEGKSRTQYLMSFDSDGKYRSRLEIDPGEMVVNRFAIQKSGDVLLVGTKLGVGPRIAIMEAGGGGFHDVFIGANEGDDHEQSLAGSPRVSDILLRGSDGRIYFVPRGQESVHVIEASGESRFAFNLTPMARNVRLVDLEEANNRFAAVYFEEGLAQGGRVWVTVYDALLGERVAVYGPIASLPVCFESRDGQDQFTLLSGGTLLTVSP
jgi:hypothetical protein